jgi:hypothetical protein
MIALILAASIASTNIHGTWSALAKGDRVHLTVVRNHSDWGRTLPRSDFTISDADLNSPSEKAVQFSFKHDAGTIDFNGTFENGEGVGRFTFTPNPSYPQALRSLGVSSDEAFDDERLFSLAMHDISLAFIREMQSLGYNENLQRYIAFRIHGVSPEFVRDLKSLGYSVDAEKLIAFRIHGVSPDFIRDLKSLGYTVDAEQLIAFRIHGVTPQFIRELRDLGYKEIDPHDLVSMRIHGVTPEYIREVENAGYHGVPVEKLIQMRIHGIDAAMLRAR